jgi:hypothetical protein
MVYFGDYLVRYKLDNEHPAATLNQLWLQQTLMTLSLEKLPLKKLSLKKLSLKISMEQFIRGSLILWEDLLISHLLQKITIM